MTCPMCHGSGWLYRAIWPSTPNYKSRVGCHVCETRGQLVRFSPVKPEPQWRPGP